MMTNSAGMIRTMITYGLCILFAVVMGYILTDVGLQPTYQNLFALGLLAALVLSPIFIKWHYPMMVFGLGLPVWVFFLKGSPPVWEIVVIISLGIAIVERTVQRKQKWLSAPSVAWPLFFTILMVLITARLTGGFGLHTMGNEVGGGKKYIALFLGIATFFALTSRKIPEERRNFYIGLYFLAGLPSFFGDLGPILPSPLNYINILIPPSVRPDQDWQLGITRLGALGTTAKVVIFFMLAKFGLRGIFTGNKALWRAPLFFLMFACSMLGGFRNEIFTLAVICFLMFFLEGLQRTRLLPLFVMIGVTVSCLLVPFARHLPYTFQRSLSFLPLDIDPTARLDAEGSSEWRFKMWHDLWPQVPQYLLLGKGYALTFEDFQMLQGGSLANGAEAQMNAGEDALAVAGDYHSGPLSTLIPFGVWGAITFLWFMLAGLRVVYRNFKYGDPQLRIVNVFLLAEYFTHMLSYLFIYGAYSNDVFGFAKTAGFSIALNGGVLGPKTQPQPAVKPQVKTFLRPELQPV
jgi:hypothetical protein